MENFMDIFPSIQDMYGNDIKSLVKDGIGVLVVISSCVNIRHSEKQIDKAFDMPENTQTDRICRQIRMLETRVWSQSWEIVLCFGLVVIFI